MSQKDEKNELRALLLAKRRAIDEGTKGERDRRLCEVIRESAVFRETELLFAYDPLSHEIDIMPLLRLCLAEGRRLALPRTLPRGVMHFHLVRSLDELTVGRMGIREPDANAEPVLPEEGTLILVPALAYDRQGYRIGYGGGYYDRYLRTHPARTLGVTYEDFLLDRIPREPHDLSVFEVATERRVLPT